MAEYHYSKGWPPATWQSGFVDLIKARDAYPFASVFREGPQIRLRILGQTGR